MNGLKDFWSKFIILFMLLATIILLNTGINSKIIDDTLTKDNKDTATSSNISDSKKNNDDDSTKNNNDDSKKNRIAKNSYIPEPKQSNIKNSAPTTVMIGGLKVQMTRLATYDITGVVLDTATFNDVVGPIDVGLAWGKLAQNNNYKGLTSYHVDNRQLTWYSNNGEWMDKMGGSSVISNCCSNNHLVPANDTIRKEILKIKNDTYIQIKGYLVYLEWKIGNTKYTWGPSSLSRTDSGDGACEIIYVQSIQFL